MFLLYQNQVNNVFFISPGYSYRPKALHDSQYSTALPLAPNQKIPVKDVFFFFSPLPRLLLATDQIFSLRGGQGTKLTAVGILFCDKPFSESPHRSIKISSNRIWSS